MGNLARDVLFRMSARDVIRYTLFKVTSIDELDARTSSCNDSETALTCLTNPIELKWLRSLFITDQTLTFKPAIQLIVRELCMLTRPEQFSIVCCICDTCCFFLLKYRPRREGVAENETIT